MKIIDQQTRSEILKELRPHLKECLSSINRDLVSIVREVKIQYPDSNHFYKLDVYSDTKNIGLNWRSSRREFLTHRYIFCPEYTTYYLDTLLLNYWGLDRVVLYMRARLKHLERSCSIEELKSENNR